MATNIEQYPSVIKGIGLPTYHTIRQTTAVPTDLNYKFEVLVYNKGTVISVKNIPNSAGTSQIDLSKILNSYVSFDWQPTITASASRPNSCINARLKWTSYTSNTIVETEDTGSTLTYFPRFVAFNGSKPLTWSYQDYVMNGVNQKPLTEFTYPYRKFMSTDYATMSVLNGYIDQAQFGNTNYSQPCYMIVDVTYTGTGFDYPNRKIFSLRGVNYTGSGFNTDKTTLQSTSALSTDFPVGPANILANLGLSTNPAFSFRTIYTGAITESMTPARYYATATYAAGTTILDSNLVSYNIYWVSALPTFTGSVATWLTNLEALRVSIKTNISYDCEAKYDTIQMSWLNQMGAFDYYTFKKASHKQLDINRKMFEKYSYSLGSSFTVTQNTYGIKSYDTNFTTSYIINTDWLREDECTALETLFTSISTYAKIDSTWYSVVLDMDSVEIWKNPENKLKQYSIRVILSNDNKTISL